MKAKEVLNLLRITRQTLTNYVKNGIIKVEILKNGRYDYDNQSVYSFLNKNIQRNTYIYARVSTNKQKKDLENQIEILKQFCFKNGYIISGVFSDIASGDVCVVFGWSGDILQGSNSAKEANNGVEINYVVPKEGALVWYDMMAIPADAEHVDSAYKYMNYILEPKVIADISNYTSYSNAVAPALELVDESIASNPNITIPEDKLKLMFVIKPHDAKINKVINTIWTKIKSSKK